MDNSPSSGNMGHKKVTSIVTFFLLLPLLMGIITVTQAANVAGISFSQNSITITPDNPVAGTPISIKLTLNNSNTEITEVDVYFYKNSIDSESPAWKTKHVSLSASDGINDSQTNVTVIWQDVNVDDQGIYVKVKDSASGEYSDSEYKSFIVQGLPDLIITNVEISPNEDVHENDEFFVNVTILNQGTLPAGASNIMFYIEGSGISQTTSIDSLNADSSTIISFNSSAPQTGNWTIQLNVDSNYEINELNEQNNNWNGYLLVTDIPDMYFGTSLNVATSDGGLASVNGPWILSGILFATEANEIETGENIPVDILITDSEDSTEVRINTNIVWNSNSSEQEFTLDFDSNDINEFSIGTHDVSLILDPNSNVEHNGDNSNDIIHSSFQLVNSPNIVVNIISSPTNGIVNVGSNVSWYVNLQNIGLVKSSGTLSANWRGMSLGPYELVIAPNNVETIQMDVEAGSTEGNFTFSVIWQPDTSWMDSNNSDNSDQITVNVDIPFLLNFDLYSVNITPNQPYIMGREHVLLISVNSTDEGSQTIVCKGEEGEIISSKELTFTKQDKHDLFECTFTPNETGLYQLKLIFEQGNGQDYTMTLQIDPPDSLLNVEGEDSTDFLILLIPFTLLLIGALIAGIILTRKNVDLSNVIYVDIEDDGYDPEELNISIGDKVMWTNYDEEAKHTVSAKSLNEDGQLLFHSGDLEDHDEFTHEFNTAGTFEYGCKYNTKFRGIINVFGLEDEDLDVIIKGSSEFAKDIAEMGFDEEELESEWDERITEAEAEVETVRSKQEAELLEDENQEYVDDDDEVKMRIEDEDLELKSQRGEYNKNMDEILASKGDLKALKDEDIEFTASDASMRAELYALTGEDGVMPGDDVNIGLGTNKEHLEGKSDFVGNQLPSIETDFTFDDSEDVIHKEIEKDVSKDVQTAECGGCGADIPVDAKSCQICGAKFE